MERNIIDRKVNDATKKFTALHGDMVVDMVNDLYGIHGVRPSSRTIMYRLKGLGLIGKGDVKKVEALVALLKLTGRIDVHKMIDAKRSMYGTSTYKDAKEATDELAGRFKMDLWKDQDNKVLIMCEASGYTDVISAVASKYRCDYMGSGGDISVHWKVMIASAGYTHIVYVGDMDTKGMEIPVTMIDDINFMQNYRGMKNTELVRIEHDVLKYDVELENVDIDYIRDLISDEVNNLIDMVSWKKSLAVESDEAMKISSND